MPSTGPTHPGTGKNIDNAGGEAWLNPDRITATDDSDTLTDIDVQSDYLTGVGYGFSVSESVVGVEAIIRARENSAGSVTGHVQLQSDDSTLIGSEKTFAIDNSGVRTNYTEGGATDPWGASLTAAIVNASTFGIRFWIEATHTVGVDSMTLNIFTAAGGADRGAPRGTRRGTQRGVHRMKLENGLWRPLFPGRIIPVPAGAF